MVPISLNVVWMRIGFTKNKLKYVTTDSSDCNITDAI